ncbi:hypothetical protein [Shinella sp.]|uniref:hypothetical protein n=1 Tax=Shinella sp. TaxID=1870904 RepID=UPI003F72E85D
MRTRFLDLYRSIYSYTSSDSVETVSVRLTGRGRRPGKLDFRQVSIKGGNSGAPTGERKVYFGKDHGWVATPIYSRMDAPSDIVGPAILEGADSTVVIPPDATGRTDPYRNLLIELGSN